MAWGIEIRAITKTFYSGDTEGTLALDRVSLDIRPGDFVSVVGPNGAGKSTLFRILAGQCAPDHGSVHFFPDGPQRGVDLLSAAQRSRKIAYVHQEPGQGTFSDLTVLENLKVAALDGFPSVFHRSVPRPFSIECEPRLAAIGLTEKAKSFVFELSQGQKQLLALESAVTRRPYVLLLDEHTASLDERNASACMQATDRLWRDEDITVMMITHNFVDAIAYGNRLIALKDGGIAIDVKDEEKRQITVEDLLRLLGMLPGGAKFQR